MHINICHLVINAMKREKQVKRELLECGEGWGGKAAILGEWRSGRSMDVTFRKILKELSRPCDGNSPFLPVQLISMKTLSPTQLPPDISL